MNTLSSPSLFSLHVPVASYTPPTPIYSSSVSIQKEADLPWTSVNMAHQTEAGLNSFPLHQGCARKPIMGKRVPKSPKHQGQDLISLLRSLQRDQATQLVNTCRVKVSLTVGSEFTRSHQFCPLSLWAPLS